MTLALSPVEVEQIRRNHVNEMLELHVKKINALLGVGALPISAHCFPDEIRDRLIAAFVKAGWTLTYKVSSGGYGHYEFKATP